MQCSNEHCTEQNRPTPEATRSTRDASRCHLIVGSIFSAPSLRCRGRLNTYKAKEAGLINRVVEDPSALVNALHAAEKLSKCPTQSVQITK